MGHLLTIRFKKTVRYYPLDEPNQLDSGIAVVKHSDYEEWLNHYYNHPDPNTSVIMRLLHLYLSKREDFEAVKILLGDNGLKLMTDIFIFYDQGNKFYFVEFFPYYNRKSSTSFSYNKLSLGTRRLLRIIVSLFHDQSTVEEVAKYLDLNKIKQKCPSFRPLVTLVTSGLGHYP